MAPSFVLLLIGMVVTLANAASDSSSPRYTNITTTVFTTEKGSTSYKEGPRMRGTEYLWKTNPFLLPTVVGTVQIIVNTDTNRTATSTKFKTQYANNGSISILTRTDTNSAGTVTAVRQAPNGSNFTLAYPTETAILESNMTFTAMLPTSWKISAPTTFWDILCCQTAWTYVPTPAHTPFPTPTITTDPADPSGWLYTLHDNGMLLFSSNISSLWSTTTLDFEYNGCPYASCTLPPGVTAVGTSSVAADAAVNSQAFLLDTHTITTSGKDKTTTSASAKATSTPVKHSTVEADPVTAKDPTAPKPATTAPKTSEAEEASPSKAPTTSIATQPEQTSKAVEQEPTKESSDADPTKPQTTAPNTQEEPKPTSEAEPQANDTPSSAGVQPTTNGLGVQTSNADAGETNAATPSRDLPQPTGDSSTDDDGTEGSNEEASQNDPPSAASTQRETTVPAPIVVGSATISQVASSQFVISGQTLAPDTPITLGEGSSTTVIALSVGPSDTVLQVGTEVAPVPASPEPTGDNNAAPIVVGSNTIMPDAATQYTISGQTLVAGSSITVGTGSGATIIGLATGPSGTVLQVGSSESIVQPVVTTNDAAPIVVGGNTFTQDQSSNYVIGGQTLAPDSPITIGTGSEATVIALSAGPSGTVLQVGSSESLIQAAVPTNDAAPIVVGDSTVIPDQSSNYVIDGQTLAPGSPVTIGTGDEATVVALSAGPSGTVLQVGSSTSVIQAAAKTGNAASIVIGGSTILPDQSSNYVVDGQTLAPGFSITAGSGSSATVIALSAGASETVLQIGSSVSTIRPASQITDDAAPIVVRGSTITPGSASEYVVSGQTLVPGSSITIGTGSSATVIALQTDASQTLLVVGSSTSALTPAVVVPASSTPPAITIGSSVVSANSASDYVIGSQTLKPGGPAITVSGSVVSLANGATALVVGSSTKALASQSGLGGYIWSEFGGDASSTSRSTARATTSSSGSASATTSRTSQQGTESYASAAATTSSSSADHVCPRVLIMLVVAAVFVLF